MAAARAVLEELKSHIAEVDGALRYISGIGGNARRRRRNKGLPRFRARVH